VTRRLRVGVDVGGTFTDLVASDVRSGESLRVKVPTTPSAPERGVADALDALLAGCSDPVEIAFFGHSTTIATNALLGQMGLELPRVAMVVTHGFADAIEIGRQNRSAIYDLFVARPTPLAARGDRLTVRERIDYRGEVLLALDPAQLAALCDELRDREVAAVAVCLLNSYANDAHERMVADAIAQALPGVAVTRSAEIDPGYREYERFSTAVVNAALAPIVQRYLERLQRDLRDRGVAEIPYVMRSDGGLARADAVAARPAALIESGPAAGVIAAASLAGPSRTHLLAFDMGGTTAKAGTIVEGAVQVATEFEAAGKTHSGRAVKGSGYPVRFPFVDLAEVSAGGGTIAWIDDAGSLRVGPLSAGADPGPACYGRSERATVTDANVVLGRLNQTHLLGGTFPIDATRARAAVAALSGRLGLSVEETAAGIVTLIDAEMAKVLRIVTIERGLDPRDFHLVAYGGGGPLHACSLASELNVSRALVPAHPGLACAQGLLIADLTAHAMESLLQATGEIAFDALEACFARLEASTRAALVEQGADAASIRLRRSYDARYFGQSFEISIDHAPSAASIEQRFHDAHRARYGYAATGERVELVNARSTAFGRLAGTAAPPARAPQSRAASAGAVTQHRALWIDGAYVSAPVFARESLAHDARIAGPAIVEQYDTTVYVAPGWTCASYGDVLELVAPGGAA
jgi:N-methylhydantoinase A